MREDGRSKINAHRPQGLALRFVYGHGEGQSNGELSSPQREAESLIVRQRAAIDQAVLTVKVTPVNSRFQAAPRYPCNRYTGTITQTLLRVKVPYQYNWGADPQLQPRERETRVVQAIKELGRKFFTAQRIFV